MRIGVPREIKDHEYRVGLTPAGAQVLVEDGHDVQVETRAGDAVGFDDAAYRAAGAGIAATAAEIYASDLVIKVKELQAGEFALTRPAQIVFCYQHLAPDAALLAAMLERKVSCLAYEAVTAADGSLPLLAPMSAIAGRLAIQVGAAALQMTSGGSGVLLAGAPGVTPGKVVIVGGGTVGMNAARVAIGIGADVTVLARTPERLRALAQLFGERLKTRVSAPQALCELTRDADLIVGAVLVPGKLSPKLIRRDDVADMRAGSVIVDVGIDQGGIAETSRATSHSNPTYVEAGVVHYCVPNMPSAVARTATLALTQATLPYAVQLARHGLRAALAADAGLSNGLQVHAGKVTHRNLALDVRQPFVPVTEALS